MVKVGEMKKEVIAVDGSTKLESETDSLFVRCIKCGHEKVVNRKILIRKLRQIGITPRTCCKNCGYVHFFGGTVLESARRQ